MRLPCQISSCKSMSTLTMTFCRGQPLMTLCRCACGMHVFESLSLHLICSGDMPCPHCSYQTFRKCQEVFVSGVAFVFWACQHAPLPKSGHAHDRYSAIRCVEQAVRAPATEVNPAVLQQWVPYSVANEVKMVKVSGLRGGKGGARQLPLTRELIAVDWRKLSRTRESSSRLPPAQASISMSRRCGKLPLWHISHLAHGGLMQSYVAEACPHYL